jgi:DNA-binding YbaB/EbfC family protein
MNIDFDQAIKKAQELKQKFEKNQKEASKKTFTADSGGGLVTVKINGEGSLLNIDINDKLLDDKIMLQDLILSAVNNAIQKKNIETKDSMKSLNQGFNIPGLDDLF